MAPETLEQIPVDRLALKPRADLQIEVIRQMLGDNPSPEAELAWAKKYSTIISDLIDHHEHDEIRELALAGDYELAAKCLINLLPE